MRDDGASSHDYVWGWRMSSLGSGRGVKWSTTRCGDRHGAGGEAEGGCLVLLVIRSLSRLQYSTRHSRHLPPTPYMLQVYTRSTVPRSLVYGEFVGGTLTVVFYKLKLCRATEGKGNEVYSSSSSLKILRRKSMLLLNLKSVRCLRARASRSSILWDHIHGFNPESVNDLGLRRSQCEPAGSSGMS